MSQDRPMNPTPWTDKLAASPIDEGLVEIGARALFCHHEEWPPERMYSDSVNYWFQSQADDEKSVVDDLKEQVQAVLNATITDLTSRLEAVEQANERLMRLGRIVERERDDAIAECGGLRDILDDERDVVDVAEARVAALEEGLRPFAVATEWTGWDDLDNRHWIECRPINRSNGPVLSAADFRRARALLSQQPEVREGSSGAESGTGVRAPDTAGGASLDGPFQRRVEPWMRECFGDVIPFDRVERGDRLLEEVFELLQSGGYDPARVLALRDYVWGRDVGEPTQELGGVMVTLAAYSLAFGLDMHQAGETELARIWTKVPQIRAKQAAKPTGSALPIALPDQQRGASVEWRPIETAPKDGTWFLATDGLSTRCVHWADIYDRLPTGSPPGMWARLPTHWMPLPAPPPLAQTVTP